MKKLLIILLLFLNHSFSQSLFELDSAIEKIIKKYKLIGLSICVILDNNIIFEKYSGFADIKNKRLINDSTCFRIASISKTVTGTAIMQLYEKGLINLDDDISNYLGYKVRNPKYPEDIITIRQLANHISSLNDGLGYGEFLNFAYSSNIPDIKDLLTPQGKFYTKDIWGNYKPGTKYSYCNAGYALLGTIVEKVTKMRFDLYCKKNIFDKLGMKSSFNVDDMNLNNIAVLYRDSIPQFDNYEGHKVPRDLSNYLPGTNAAAFAPQGGLRTSAKDLSKFLRAHINKGVFNNHRILSDSSCVLMHSSVFPLRGLGFLSKKSTISFHFTESLLKDNVLIGHAGGAYGLLSGMYFDKNRKYGIIFFANGGKYGNYSSGYTDFEKELVSIIYFYLRPLIDVKNYIFTDIEILKVITDSSISLKYKN